MSKLETGLSNALTGPLSALAQSIQMSAEGQRQQMNANMEMQARQMELTQQNHLQMMQMFQQTSARADQQSQALAGQLEVLGQGIEAGFSNQRVEFAATQNQVQAMATTPPSRQTARMDGLGNL